MYDVITVGSATIDCFVDTGDELFQYIRRKNKKKDGFVVHVPFGTKITVDKLIFLTGGGGTNTAVSFARLGLKTGMLGKFGGEQANLILSEMKKEKITPFIAKGASTGFSVVLDAKGHDRTILAYKGDNNTMKYSEVPLSKLKTKWFYMASMVGESYKTLEKLITYASKNNIKVAFNPSSYIAKKGVRALSRCLKKTDVLVFNREEAGELLGKDYTNIHTMFDELSKVTTGIIVVTDGNNGTHCGVNGEIYYLPANKKIKPIETTGAGDSFGSAFVAGLIAGKSIPECLQMGQANAESVILHPGAKVGLRKKLAMNKAVKSGMKVSVLEK